MSDTKVNDVMDVKTNEQSNEHLASSSKTADSLEYSDDFVPLTTSVNASSLSQSQPKLAESSDSAIVSDVAPTGDDDTDSKKKAALKSFFSKAKLLSPQNRSSSPDTSIVETSSIGKGAGGSAIRRVAQELGDIRAVRAKQQRIKQEEDEIQKKIDDLRIRRDALTRTQEVISNALRQGKDPVSQEVMTSAEKLEMMQKKVEILEELGSIADEEGPLLEKRRNPEITLTAAEKALLRGAEALAAARKQKQAVSASPAVSQAAGAASSPSRNKLSKMPLMMGKVVHGLARRSKFPNNAGNADSLSSDTPVPPPPLQEESSFSENKNECMDSSNPSKTVELRQEYNIKRSSVIELREACDATDNAISPSTLVDRLEKALELTKELEDIDNKIRTAATGSTPELQSHQEGNIEGIAEHPRAKVEEKKLFTQTDKKKFQGGIRAVQAQKKIQGKRQVSAKANMTSATASSPSNNVANAPDVATPKVEPNASKSSASVQVALEAQKVSTTVTSLDVGTQPELSNQNDLKCAPLQRGQLPQTQSAAKPVRTAQNEIPGSPKSLSDLEEQCRKQTKKAESKLGLAGFHTMLLRVAHQAAAVQSLASREARQLSRDLAVLHQRVSVVHSHHMDLLAISYNLGLFNENDLDEAVVSHSQHRTHLKELANEYGVPWPTMSLYSKAGMQGSASELLAEAQAQGKAHLKSERAGSTVWPTAVNGFDFNKPPMDHPDTISLDSFPAYRPVSAIPPSPIIKQAPRSVESLQPIQRPVTAHQRKGPPKVQRMAPVWTVGLPLGLSPVTERLRLAAELATFGEDPNCDSLELSKDEEDLTRDDRCRMYFRPNSDWRAEIQSYKSVCGQAAKRAMKYTQRMKEQLGNLESQCEEQSQLYSELWRSNRDLVVRILDRYVSDYQKVTVRKTRTIRKS